jgi:transcriptional regulator with XRE-family HTH domain
LTKKGKATDDSLGIAERLLSLRQAQRLTQRDVAEMLKVSCQQYQKYEKGKDRISLEKIRILCRNLNLPLNFFGEEEPVTGFAETSQEGFGGASVSPREYEILEIYRAIPKKAQNDFIEAVRPIAKMLASKK